jgi:hypothetical protein
VTPERIITPPEAQPHHSTAKQDQGTETGVEATPQIKKNSQHANNKELET